jgi:hypothetical protein
MENPEESIVISWLEAKRFWTEVVGGMPSRLPCKLSTDILIVIAIENLNTDGLWISCQFPRLTPQQQNQLQSAKLDPNLKQILQGTSKGKYK